MTTHLLGFSGTAFVTDENGVVSLAPAVPVGAFGVAAAAVLPALIADADAFYAPNIIGPTQTLLPALVTELASPTTWNTVDKSANITLSGGGLIAAASSATAGAVRGTNSALVGKYYFEVVSSGTLANSGVGIATSAAVLGSVGSTVLGAAFVNAVNGAIFVNGTTSVGGVGGAMFPGDIICVAVDLDNQRIWFRAIGSSHVGNWNNSATANPATNVGGYDISAVFATARAYPLVTFASSALQQTANFGATAFTQTVPGGFSAWDRSGLEAFFVPSVAAGAAAAQTLLPGLVIDADAFFAPVLSGQVALLPAAVSDADAFPAPSIASSAALSPALVDDADAIFASAVDAPGAAQTLLPALVSDPDGFFAPSIAAGAGAAQTLLSELVADPDVIFATIAWSYASLLPVLAPSDDVIPAPSLTLVLQPELVANDDLIRGHRITLFLVPDVVVDADAIPAADVGWGVEALFVEDGDVVFTSFVEAFAELRPALWADEEHLETYPFYIQHVTGGVPVPPPPDVLTGSLQSPRTLTGSFASRGRRTLTGSFPSRTRPTLTGSLRHRRR